MKIRSILLFLTMVFSLSGCLKTEKPLYSKSDGIMPLVGEFGFYQHEKGVNTSIHIATSEDGFYRTQSTSDFVSAIVVPLEGHKDHYIMQIDKKKNVYEYLLIKYSAGGMFSSAKFTYTPVKVDEIVKANKSLRIESRKGDNGGWFIRDKETLQASYSLAVRKGFLKEDSRYQIFDLFDEEQKREFVQLLSDRDKLDKFSFTGSGDINPKIDTGNWVFSESVDAMTDKKSPIIVGQSTEYSGTPIAPVAKFYCGENSRKPHIELFWGAPVEPMDRSADVQIVVVDLRFDKEKPIKTIWQPSKNYDITWEINDPAKGFIQASIGALGLFDPSLKEATATWSSVKLASIMAVGKSMIVRTMGYSGVEITAIFDLAGFDNAFKQFQRSCN